MMTILSYSILLLSMSYTFFRLLKSENSVFNFSFLVVILIGVMLSKLSYQKSIGLNNFLVDGICKSKIVNTSCDIIFTTKKWKILNFIDLTQISLLFFITQLVQFIIFLYLNTLNDYYFYYKFLLYGFIPISLISLYYQIIVEKKICPLCIGIISTVYIEISMLFFINIPFYFNIELIVVFFLILFIVIFLFQYYTKKEEENLSLQKQYVEYKKFRKNYNFFKNNLLNSNKLMNNNLDNAILAGNIKSKLKITIFTNPFCKHCKELFLNLKAIYNKNDDILFIIYFDYNPNINNDFFNKVYTTLIGIYLDKGGIEFINALYQWYEIENQNDFLKQYNYEFSRMVKDKLEGQRDWAISNFLSFTPYIYINGYEYPITYKKEDLEYFISEILEDTEESHFLF